MACCKPGEQTLIFGNITNLIGESFSYAGASFSNTTAGTDVNPLAWVIDRPGILHRMRVRHNNPLVGGDQIYTFRRAPGGGVFAATVLTMTVDSNVFDAFLPNVSLAVAEGDVINLMVNNTTAVNQGLRVTVFLQHRRTV